MAAWSELRVTMPEEKIQNTGQVGGQLPLPPDEYLVVRGTPVRRSSRGILRFVVLTWELAQPLSPLAKDFLTSLKERGIIDQWEVVVHPDPEEGESK